ncbi:hypothetical protein CCR75_008679 [Bremia lactucae]|uniref:Uncharacterized protein n=1 Tax=Bremia lactucae TaxID=4779 RepID=A0A976FL80_BRELC|nr:hypothetical protein CCR75_008679 [Bremia lactucae]
MATDQQNTAKLRETVTAGSRAPPFASGPVAMVNQPRPGFNTPGQFPGHAVRAAPTQLSTPLVPQRHLVAPTASVSSDMLPSLFGDSRNSRLDSTDDIFAQSAPAGVHSAAELFGQNSHAAFGRFRSGTSDLFSRQQVRCEIPTQQLSQQDDYEILFSSPKKLSKTATPLISRHPSSHGFLHSASKSAPPPTHSQSTQQYPSYIQQSPSLTFGQAPPPTAPILKFGDSHRSESIRSSTSEAQKCQEPSEAVCLATSTPSPGLSQITLEIPSSDKLVHDFLKFQVHERFARFANYPATSKLLCSDIPDTVEGLKALYVQQRWKTLTKKSLQMLQDPRKHIDVVLEIKSWWLAGLIKEGHYDNAASVLDQIGDLDELPVLGGSTSFVHIRLLLLQALLSKCQGKIVNHEKQLFHLILRLQGARQQNNWQVFENVDKEIFARWLRIAQFALANHLVHQQKFRLALRVSSQIDVSLGTFAVPMNVEK